MPPVLLDDAQRARYRVDGWLVVRGVLDVARVQALQQAVDELEERARDVVVDTNVRGMFFEVQSASGRKRERAVAPGVLRKITSPSRGHAMFRALRTDPDVLALVASCGVHDPHVVVDQVNPKHPGLGTGFPYHQDAGFLHGDALRDVMRHGGVNLVIALDPADEDNGGFTVLGRTHTHGLSDMAKGYDTSQTNDGFFDETHKHTPALAPGDAVLFDPFLAHGSAPNRSTRRRRLITLWTLARGPAPG